MGVLNAAEAEQLDLNEAGAADALASGTIHNLDGSVVLNGVPFIGSHADVTSPAITWAFLSPVASV